MKTIKKGHAVACPFCSAPFTSRLRTVNSNLDAEAPIASEGVVTYVKRGSDAKKGHAIACPFCSAPRTLRLRTVNSNLDAEAPIASDGVGRLLQTSERR